MSLQRRRLAALFATALLATTGMAQASATAAPDPAPPHDAAASVVAPDAQQVGTNRLLSRAADGSPATGASSGPSMSSDGRYVVFSSTAQDLVAGDRGPLDVFLLDRVTGRTTLISQAFNDRRVRGNSSQAQISGDGRIVVFTSVADNLVRGDDNGHYDVFVYDVETAGLSIISRSSDGDQGAGNSSEPVVSRDGRYVAFQSDAPNLSPADANGIKLDVFLHDRATRETRLVSHRPDGRSGVDAASYVHSISADGRLVGFTATGRGMTRQDTARHFDAFVYDRDTDRNAMVSVSEAGVPADDDTTAALVSADGRFVVMASDARNLGSGDDNGFRDVYVRELGSGDTSLVSVTSGGEQRPGDSFVSAVSDDGTLVLITSTADLTDAGAPTDVREAYLRDRTAGTTTLVSRSPSGEPGDGWSDFSQQQGDFAADGRLVAYDSFASNLVAGDDNALSDVFVYRIR